MGGSAGSRRSQLPLPCFAFLKYQPVAFVYIAACRVMYKVVAPVAVAVLALAVLATAGSSGLRPLVKRYVLMASLATRGPG